ERGFPEGPTVLPDGRLVFCDGNIGELSVYADGAVGTFAVVGGSPWGAVLGSDGAIYVTQGGNVPGSGDTSAISGIQRVRSDRTGRGEMVLELPDVYPNGIAFDAQKRLYWTESMAHRVCRLDAGAATVFCQLSDDYVPDGMAFAADGRAFVCTTVSEGVSVLSPDGVLLEHIDLGEHATNCTFDGPTLYVTATHVADIEAS